MDGTAGDTAFERREPAPAWQTWLETAAIPAALLAAGALLDRGDPFLLRRGFSWLALAPLLVGLRYGSVPALACAAAQALALAASWRLVGLPHASASEIALGWLVAGFAAGRFRDAWSRRGRQLEAQADRLGLRLDVLARAYRALEASHEELQRGAPGRPACLRDALAALRRELIEGIDAGALGAAGGRILALFSRHALVRAATLHAVDEDRRPGPAICSLGNHRGAGDDPLVLQAARLGEVVSLRDARHARGALAAVPLVDSAGRVHAVVAIHDLPFVAFHAESLELLAVLGGHIGDLFSRTPPPALRAHPSFRAAGPTRRSSPGYVEEAERLEEAS